MYFIIGLGNPGIKYINTRHNAGFIFLDYLNDQFIQKSEKDMSSYRYVIGNINNNKVCLVKPQTYMNLSGKVLVDLENDFDSFEKFMIVYDDIDLPIGKIRIKSEGSSGGHNGIKSIIQTLNSKKFIRMKIGIKNNNIDDVKNFVLEEFSDKEFSILSDVFNYGEKGIKHILDNDINKAMSICNGIFIEDSKK